MSSVAFIHHFLERLNEEARQSVGIRCHQLERVTKSRSAYHAGSIEKYLGSGMVKGIGPIFAKRLVGKFGAEVLAVIEERWADLELVEGIGPKRRQRIVQAWAEGKRIAYPQDWYSLTMAPR